ncbi:hypothetical protein [Pseudomonas sp. Fl4BN1]|uniref:hypothetical protein n=1 Tax=Pseudomonas sp. Fl4BN1 TaxID=2697651 RepID=UPI001378CD90|nr:hypothetical protein [Pseudomonas sp. Fl4BN1]NBF10838.1 hypothetical protein [Pseudomonas sp. Fl4BN1]
MTTMSDIGKAIRENIIFVSKLGAECDRLAQLIREELSRLLLSSEVARRYRAGGEWLQVNAEDDHGWVFTDISSSLPLIIKPKRSIGDYLIVQISLTGMGVDACDNHEPLIHIGRFNAPIDFDTIHMTFPLDVEDRDGPDLENQRLLRWEDGYWCYSLRLTDINNPADVQRCIIKPMAALLLENSAVKLLSEAGAVKYAKVPKEPGQFRALPR